jgi:hypothetical protein
MSFIKEDANLEFRCTKERFGQIKELQVQGVPYQESAHSSQSISDPPNIFSRVYLGAPIDLMGLLIEKKACIAALFCNTSIYHCDLCFSASFDEEVLNNGGMFIQQAYFLSDTDFVADEADVFPLWMN